MRPLIPLALAAAAVLSPLAAPSADAQTVYHVYFLGGQSNMEGYGYIRELPAELRTAVPGVRIYHGSPAPDESEAGGKGIWAELRPGHGTGFSSDGTSNHYSERFGVELTLARRLRELHPDRNIALIKYARDGSSIDAEAAGRFGSWDPDYRAGTGINQYDYFLTTLRGAMDVDDIDGDGAEDVLVPAGIVWMQGESDAQVEAIARRYEGNLKRLVDLIRAALRVDDLPAVIGRISDSGREDDGKVWDYGDLVREAQAAFVRRDERAALVTTTDRYAYSDKWHYDSAGYVDLGHRFAEAMAQLQKEHAPKERVPVERTQN